MTINQLEQIIEGQAESPNLDFKTDMAWRDQSFAKDFLAMSNMRDGGTIVIGVEEKAGVFTPIGVSAANEKTYKIDIMRSQLASFCDPSPEFRVDFPKDTTGRTFVVIQIAPFRDLPLLSKKGVPSVILANTIYYRNTNKGVESAPISNAHDMRDLIELAARNMIRRRREFGWELPSGMDKVFDADLADLPPDGLLASIKAGAYWEVEFRPSADLRAETLHQLEDLVQKAVVRLNWPFPSFAPGRQGPEGLEYGDSYIEGFANHPYIHEFWRFYMTGHFLLYRKLQDDDLVGIPGTPVAGTYISYLLSIIYFITEAVEFLSRLAAAGTYTTGGQLIMNLHNVRDRGLYLGSQGHLMYPRTLSAPILRISTDVIAEELLDDPMRYSRKIIVRVLDSFRFHPSADNIQRLQQDYLAKR